MTPVSFRTIFLSTLSLRRATGSAEWIIDARGISIHALLAESDRPTRPLSTTRTYFYPRSPCGERPRATARAGSHSSISIHALLAESDLAYPDMIICTNVISIHALLAESDLGQSITLRLVILFLSTLSLRRATMISLLVSTSC